MKEVKHKDAAEQMGYTMIPNAVLFNTDLSVPARVLFGLLKHFAWLGTEPKQETLAHVLGVSRRSIVAYLSELETAGLLTRTRRGLTQTNLYELAQPKLRAVHRASDAQPASHQDAQPASHHSTKSKTSTYKDGGSGSETPYPPDVTDKDLEAGRAEIQRFRSGGSD